MLARFLFAAAVPLLTACGGGLDLTPEPFTRERADGKIPVKTALIREQVLAQLAGMPEGEAKVTRWQHIETDYHACRLLSGKAETASEQVFADCMANRGYVYMYRIDAEHLHNDIEFEVEKEYDKYPDTAQKAAEALLAAQTKREEEQREFARREELPDNGSYANYLYALAGIGGIAALAAGGGGDSNNSPAAQPRITPTITMPTPTMAMTMADPLPSPRSTEPSPVALTSQHFGAWHTRASNGSFYFVVRLLTTGATSAFTADVFTPRLLTHPQSVVFFSWFRGRTVSFLPYLTRPGAFYATSPIFVNLMVNGVSAGLPPGQGQVLVESRPDITRLDLLCGIHWLATYINANFPGTTCPASGGLSYSPNMPHVIYAAMADGFNPGFAIGESAFAFSGRYDGDNRAAGFTYDLGDYSLRTDYIRLPSRQDGEVWLDTFRFGALSRVNDEVRLFAGMDNYRNAIFAIDTNGDSRHRFGVAIGEGYAAKYEYRIRL